MTGTMTMIHLVGEQPMPILLAARQMKADVNVLVATARTESVAGRLSRLLPNASVHVLKASEYDLTGVASEIEKISIGDDIVFNLTGGTKMMALGAYNAAIRRSASFVYLQSDAANRLHKYIFTPEGRMKSDLQPGLSELITADDYLRAHLPGYRAEGIHTENGRPSIGGRFEKAVAEILSGMGCEVIQGVRPDGVDRQIEIDMVVRMGNKVAVAELKKALGSDPKTGIDQLSTASSREYLGTYTGKLLIVGTPIGRSVLTLAQKKDVVTVSLPSYQDGKGFSLTDERELEAKVRTVLGA